MILVKSNFYRIIGLVILFILQSSLVVAFSDKAQFLPNFLLLFVVIFTLSRSLPASIWHAFAAGFLLELFSGWFFGAYIFAMLMSALLVYLVTRKLTAQEVSPLLGLFLVLAASLAMSLALYLWGAFFSGSGLGPAVALSQFVSWRLVPAVVINLAVFYPMLMLSGALGRLFLPPEQDAQPF